MFDRPIVIYSNYCTFSQSFMQALSEVPEIFEAFIRLCIDVDVNTGKRPDIFFIIQEQLQQKITKVPTVILNGGNLILSGSEAFSWLKSVLTSQAQKPREPDAFAPNEMVGLSDSYSKFGSNDMNDATEKSFVFLNRQLENIPTPEDDHVKITQQDYQRMQDERDSVGVTQQQQQPNSFPVRPQMHQQMQRQREVFHSGHNNSQKKGKNLDSKLEQLIMERNNLPPPANELRQNQPRPQFQQQRPF